MPGRNAEQIFVPLLLVLAYSGMVHFLGGGPENPKPETLPGRGFWDVGGNPSHACRERWRVERLRLYRAHCRVEDYD